MAAHTPGPWHVGGVGGCRPQIVYSPSGLAVLRTWGVSSMEEEEANARLAASAPTLAEHVRILREALIPLLDATADLRFPDGDRIWHAAANARDATKEAAAN